MKIWISFILLLIIGCGKIPIVSDFLPAPVDKDPRRHRQSHPHFKYYIERFEEIYGQSTSHIPINFADDVKERIGGKAVGVCWYWDSGHREIEIDPEYWDRIIDEQREQLIFHELGHCALDRRGHVDTATNGCPDSIMRSFAFNISEIDNCYIPNYGPYMDELFR